MENGKPAADGALAEIRRGSRMGIKSRTTRNNRDGVVRWSKSCRMHERGDSGAKLIFDFVTVRERTSSRTVKPFR
jgi:hypothetical protein